MSEWFDGAAADLLTRAYRHPGRPAVTYLAPPSPVRRAMAAALGIYDLLEKDRWGETRWMRAYKRSTYYTHKHYGYAGELRAGDQRAAPAAATALKWETGPLVRKAGWPTRRRQISVTILPGGDSATAAVMASRKPAKRYTVDDSFRSKPGPPDRPWEGG